MKTLATMSLLMLMMGVAISQDLTVKPTDPTIVTVTVIRNGRWYALGEVKCFKILDQLVLVVPDGPAPIPAPVTPTPTPADKFTQKVREGISSISPTSRQHAGTIAQVYESVAAEASANPGQWTVSKLLTEAKIRNATELRGSVLGEWKTFWAAVTGALLAEGLQADDLAGHVVLFQKISQELRR